MDISEEQMVHFRLGSVAIKQGGIAEAAIGGVIETIDSIINRTLLLIAK